MTGLRKRTRCTSASLTLLMPSAHHRLSCSTLTTALSTPLLLLLDAHDGAGHRAGLGGVGLLQHHLHLLAAGLVEHLAERRVGGEVDGEALERLLDGGVAVVADGGDVAAVEVAQHHALDEVVDVLRGERQVHAGVAVDGPLALEVAHAAGEQHHLPDRQLRRGVRLRRRRGRVAESGSLGGSAGDFAGQAMKAQAAAVNTVPPVRDARSHVRFMTTVLPRNGCGSLHFGWKGMRLVQSIDEAGAATVCRLAALAEAGGARVDWCGRQT